MSEMEWFVNSLRPYAAKIKSMGGVVTARQVQRRLWTFRHNGQCLLQSLVNHGFGR